MSNPGFRKSLNSTRCTGPLRQQEYISCKGCLEIFSDKLSCLEEAESGAKPPGRSRALPNRSEVSQAAWRGPDHTSCLQETLRPVELLASYVVCSRFPILLPILVHSVIELSLSHFCSCEHLSLTHHFCK